MGISDSYINSSSVVSAYQSSNPFIGGSSISWGGYETQTPGTGTTKGTQIGTSLTQGLNEVAKIGAEKAKGFSNGLGGTNDPGEHKVFYAC